MALWGLIGPIWARGANSFPDKWLPEKVFAAHVLLIHFVDLLGVNRKIANMKCSSTVPNVHLLPSAFRRVFEDALKHMLLLLLWGARKGQQTAVVVHHPDIVLHTSK